MDMLTSQLKATLLLNVLSKYTIPTSVANAVRKSKVNEAVLAGIASFRLDECEAWEYRACCSHCTLYSHVRKIVQCDDGDCVAGVISSKDRFLKQRCCRFCLEKARKTFAQYKEIAQLTYRGGF